MDMNHSNLGNLSAKLPDEAGEPELATLLELHYGDGQVYLPRNAPEHLLGLARQRGLVDAEGYLTRKGRLFLADSQSLG